MRCMRSSRSRTSVVTDWDSSVSHAATHAVSRLATCNCGGELFFDEEAC